MQRRAVERVKGIEPSSLGWEPRALPLSYTRRECGFYAAPRKRGNELSYGQPAPSLPAWSTAMRFFSPLFALALAAPLAGADESMRCGKWIIDSEVTVTDLVAKCGEPASKQIDTSEVRHRNANGVGTRSGGTTTTERWLYDRGSSSFKMVVTIVDGEVKSIDKAE